MSRPDPPRIHLTAIISAEVELADDVRVGPYVMIDGPVTLSGDLAELRKWAGIVGGRYMGADRADEYGARNGVPGELLVRLRAEHVVAMRDISG